MTKRPKIIAIIGARLSSSRLPGKHLLPLAGKPMIARIIERLETISELDQIYLATTKDSSNDTLIEWANTHNKDVFAYRGDVNDVVGRIDALVNREKPDILVYICGDSPLIEPTTLFKMIKALIDHPEVDFVSLISDPPDSKCIHEGFNVYRFSVWKKLIAVANTESEREHVSLPASKILPLLSHYYMREDKIYSRINHRISVDTQTDYQFMQEVYKRWYLLHDEHSIVDLRWVIKLLENDRQLAAINKNVKQKSPHKKSMNAILVTQCGINIGLGNYYRTLNIAKSLQDRASAGVKIVIQGETFTTRKARFIPHTKLNSDDDLCEMVFALVETDKPQVVIFDLHNRYVPKHFDKLLDRLRNFGCKLVAIDGMFDWIDKMDLIIVPSFYLSNKYSSSISSHKIVYGWETYILPPKIVNSKWEPGKSVLVLTGGSDPSKLSAVLPNIIDRTLAKDITIHWVHGPFSQYPVIPSKPKLKWIVHDSPENIGDLLENVNYTISVYGLSLFEVLNNGIPSVTISLNGLHNVDEMSEFGKCQIALVAYSTDEIPTLLLQLLNDDQFANRLSINSLRKMKKSGGTSLVDKIESLVYEASV